MKNKTQLDRVISEFKESLLAVFGLIIIFSLVTTAILAPYIAPYDPLEQDYMQMLLAPSLEHPLGTDRLGRDLLSRVIFGSRYALMVGLGIVLIQSVVGITLGLLAGYQGGIIDATIMRLVDIMLSMPIVVLGLAVAGVLGGGLLNVIIAIGLIGWRGYTRLIRGEVMSVKENDYIEASRASGASDTRIVLHHIFPNTAASIIVYATLQIPNAILISAALSFLGIGAQPPVPEWGLILSTGRDYLSTAWWIATFPGLAIMLTVLGFNFVGDGLRDALDPKLKKTTA